MTIPCSGCPWTSKEQWAKEALTDEVKAAAERGEWFCCHVHMGTCFGAERYSAAVAKRTVDDPQKRP